MCWPARVTVEAPIQQVACGDHFTALLSRDGALFGCGANWSAQLGLEPSVEMRASPVRLLSEQAVGGVAQLACGADHMAAIDGAGRLWVWGGRCGASPARVDLPRTATLGAEGERGGERGGEGGGEGGGGRRRGRRRGGEGGGERRRRGRGRRRGWRRGRWRRRRRGRWLGEGGGGVALVACGAECTLAVSGEGECFVWGNGEHGRLGLGEHEREHDGAAAARGAQPSGSTRDGGGVWPWRRQPRPGPAHARAGHAHLRGRCRRAVLALLPRVRAASAYRVC